MQFKTPLYWRLNYTVLLFYKEFHSTPSALNTAPFWWRKPERGCVDEGEMKGIPDYRFSSNCSTVTVALPSAAKVMPSADSDARCGGSNPFGRTKSLWHKECHRLFSLSKNPIIKQRNSRPRLQKSKNISQKLASKGVSTPSLQAFSDSWQQI